MGDSTRGSRPEGPRPRRVRTRSRRVSPKPGHPQGTCTPFPTINPTGLGRGSPDPGGEAPGLRTFTCRPGPAPGPRPGSLTSGGRATGRPTTGGTARPGPPSTPACGRRARSSRRRRSRPAGGPSFSVRPPARGRSQVPGRRVGKRRVTLG